MRSKKPLISLLRKLVDAVEDETSRNPEFAERLNKLMLPFQETEEVRSKISAKRMDATLPDIHAELASRTDRDFRTWLRSLPVEVLKAVISREDLDAARRASKWKDEVKLADFIADGIRARMSRGSAFMEREKKNHAMLDSSQAPAEMSSGDASASPPTVTDKDEGKLIKDEHQPSEPPVSQKDKDPPATAPTSEHSE